MLPTFFIPGEAKCGTTSLFRYLSMHPEVFPSDVKEPNNFWQYGSSPLWCRQHYPFRTTSFLRKLSGKRTVTGEASPEYLSKVSVPASIAELCPEPFLIFLFRDPVERAFSDHHMLVKAGVETVPFEERVEQSLAWIRDPGMAEVLERLNELEHHPARYLLRGAYLKNLGPWLRRFSRERMLFIESESFFADPGVEVNRTLKFLGLSPLENQEWPVFKKGRDKQPIDPEIRKRLDEYFAPLNRELYNFLGEDWSWPAS
ncbi:sulfotransferase domain-containing protein [Puniceicoccus vermicola]|nr:sulfotransferase domain-containing protein [Puniceicoccus vermicola]